MTRLAHRANVPRSCRVEERFRYDTITDGLLDFIKENKDRSALLENFRVSGQLERTLVVLATEFGRSPFIDENAGRNHHPFGCTCLLAGGGAVGGAIYGETDAGGNRPKDVQVSNQDFGATIAWALGLDHLKYETPFEGGQLPSVAGKKTGAKAE